MREAVFIKQYQKEWQDLRHYFDYRNSSARQRQKKQLSRPAISDADFPARYRRLCNQLALAETRNFSHAVIEQLNALVVEGHRQLYRRRSAGLGKCFHFFAHTFPHAMRREKAVMLWALALFILPALLTFVVIQYYPTAAYSFLDESTLTDMEKMYAPDSAARRLGESRDAASDVLMFGHYILNNVSIGLRSFASGLLAGVGAVLITAFNGLYLGVIFSHLHNAGYATQTLFPFVITHGAFELTALVISGGAGLRMGLSLLFPGRYRRGESIARTAKALQPIVIGFVVMLVIAAFIEAFWSAIVMPNAIKYASGGLCWLLVLAYFLLLGRGHEPK